MATPFRKRARRWIAASGTALVLLAAPQGSIDAQVKSISAVSSLPRFALVIGNSKYEEAPLKNPGNDARALAEELTKMGFKVDLKLDATRQQMLDAIRAYSKQLDQTKAVGLFYYAGHGAQLAWRNYLVPVDAVIDRLEDLETRTVDLAALLQGLGKARNPLNVVILDACRDNPFGTRLPVQQKGLSQFDAPPGSLLAYATAPGTVAADGTVDGRNGLYTGYLLQEMRVPQVRIEDILKRVRLNVRMKSEGQQVPWESTSLEDDFYPYPPKITKLTMEEMEKQFEEELELWQKIRGSSEVEPYENYLRKYPSGKFSELAQFRIDRLLQSKGQPRLELTLAPTPFSHGSGAKNVHFRVGEEYSYREIDLLKTAEVRRFTHRVSAVNFFEVHYTDGTITDRLNNPQPKPGVQSLQQTYIQTYSVGKSWTTRYSVAAEQGAVDVEYEYRILRREEIDTAAGTFNAFRVEGRGREVQTGNRLQHVYWIVPEVRRYVASELQRMNPAGRVVSNVREEITHYVMLK